MSKVALDLKQFKHVSSDGDVTRLKHAQGHELTIHHKSLSPEAQAQLSALSKITDSKPKEKAKPTDKPKYAEGGEVGQPPPKAFADMSKEEILQALAMDPDAFKRAQDMATGVMGSVSMVGPATIEATTAAEGLGFAKGLGGQPPLGNTVNSGVTPGLVNEMPALGKVNVLETPVQGPGLINGQKRVPAFAGGGQIPPALDPDSEQAKAIGLQQNQIPAPDDLYTWNDKQAMPAIGQAYQTGQENRVGMLKELMTPEGINASVDQKTPEQAELKALNVVSAQDDAAQQQKVIDQQQQNNTSAAIAAQRAKLGLPPDMGTPAQQGEMIAAEAAPPPTAMGPQSIAGKVEAQTGGSGLNTDPSSIFQQGFQNKMTGIGQEAKAVGDMGQAQANVLSQQVQAQQQAQSAFKEQYAGLEAERQAHMADIKAGHIDPEKYWDNHSKVAAGIGMILAGFNPTTSPNAALGFLKDQMDRNILAQSKNLDSQQNLLSANLKQFGNLKDAADMTRIMQHDIVSNQLQEAAAKAKSPMAQAAAHQAAGQLQMESANQFQQFAMRRAMMSLANTPGGPNDGAIQQMIAYKRASGDLPGAKALEDSYVPGVGYSPTAVIPQEARNQMIMRKNFGSMAQRYLQFAQQHSGSFNPAVMAQGQALAAELQGAFRQASNGGVFKEGEQKFIEKLIPDDPTQMLSQFRTNPKIKEILSTNQASLNNLASGYGLKMQQEAAQPEIKVINGVKYMRGPDGKTPIPVK